MEIQNKWEEFKNENCYDFQPDKIRAHKVKIKEAFKRWKDTFMEQFEILTYKLKLNAKNILWKYSIFPREPFENGEIVSVFRRLVKNNELERVYKIIKDDPLIVFQMDEMH